VRRNRRKISKNKLISLIIVKTQHSAKATTANATTANCKLTTERRRQSKEQTK